MRVEAVDPQRHRAPRPVEVVESLDDVDPSLLFVVGRDRVLEIKHDDVRADVRRLLEHANVAAGYRKLAAVKA
jgi:hypothetical protein